MRLFCFLVLAVMNCSNVCARQVIFPQYGVAIEIDSARLHRQAVATANEVIESRTGISGATVISDIELPHQAPSQTADFYLLLSLVLLLGLIRFMDTRYFYNLWRAFWNPTLSNRQLKDQLQGTGLPNLLMNIFFAFAGGAYMYYVVRYFTPHRSGVIPPSLLILMLVTGTGLIYLAKYAAIRFSGWAFRLEGITEHYLFNIFLINKVLGITLIPFIIILAFANGEWSREVMIISFIVAGALLLNRYIRSWQLFGSFFQYSKFHFFMYLCASELLPLAVLMKLLAKGLMFY